MPADERPDLEPLFAVLNEIRADIRSIRASVDELREKREPRHGSDLIDKPEVAKRLRLSIRTVEVMVADGRLPPPRKFGSRVQWPAAEIAKIVATGIPSLRKKPAAAAHAIEPAPLTALPAPKKRSRKAPA